jgi:hypothetical protein
MEVRGSGTAASLSALETRRSSTEGFTAPTRWRSTSSTFATACRSGIRKREIETYEGRKIMMTIKLIEARVDGCLVEALLALQVVPVEKRPRSVDRLRHDLLEGL